MNTTRALKTVALGTGLLLLLPLLAMQFSDEVNWDPGDFGIAALLLFGAGMAYALAAARLPRQRLLIGLVVGLALATIWAELAVGLFD